MRYLKSLTALCFLCCLLLTSCSKDSATGSTIASQVTGNFKSTSATIVVNNESIVEDSDEYTMTITEVDANTVSVLTEHARVFEVDLVKSENGELTTGTTNSAGSGFTFTYYVADGAITINYSDNDVTMSFAGMKE